MATPAAAFPTSNDTTAIIDQARKQYPFVSQFNPNVIVNAGDPKGDYLETWPVGETGTPDHPRPKQFPLNRVGIEIYRPNDVSPSDVAAELLHVDPVAVKTSTALLRTFTPTQIAQLKQTSKDYAVSLQDGETEQRALENAVASAMRGYVFGQWPDKANAAMKYTPTQMQMLNQLKAHVMAAPQQSGNLNAITAASESGGRDYVNGSPVTSPKGARYSMQVMPSTAGDPGFGVRPAQSDSPAEYNRVGRDYLEVLRTRYNGDLAATWGAYNWGPGNVDKAIAKYGREWWRHAPLETQTYVERNLAALGEH